MPMGHLRYSPLGLKDLRLLGVFSEHQGWVRGPPLVGRSLLATLGSSWKGQRHLGSLGSYSPAQRSQKG